MQTKDWRAVEVGTQVHKQGQVRNEQQSGKQIHGDNLKPHQPVNFNGS